MIVKLFNHVSELVSDHQVHIPLNPQIDINTPPTNQDINRNITYLISVVFFSHYRYTAAFNACILSLSL